MDKIQLSRTQVCYPLQFVLKPAKHLPCKWALVQT